MSTRHNPVRPVVETLEERTFLAGNVTAELSPELHLTLRGDRAANDILIRYTTAVDGQPIEIVGNNGTTINGQSSVVINNALGNLRVFLGRGDDKIDLQYYFGTSGYLIDGGWGNDTIRVQDIFIYNTVIRGDNGNDRIELSDVSLVGKTLLSGGSGNDAFSLEDVRVGIDALNVLGGGGKDSFFVVGVDGPGKVRYDNRRGEEFIQGVALNYSFDRGDALGWQAGFADYPQGQEQFYELSAGMSLLPPELYIPSNPLILSPVVPTYGFRISGNNHSDDLFMFLKRQIGAADGLKPSTQYTVRFEIGLGSNAPSNCFGIGGSPGESVWLKAGATRTQPVAVLDADGNLRMNVDKGDQANGGSDATVLGNIANGQDCEQAGAEPKYRNIRRVSTQTMTATTDAQGRLWLLVGTDSGFEGTTTLYYRNIQVKLIPTSANNPRPRDKAEK